MQVKKFQFFTMYRQISPEFIFCHSCTLQFKLKVLLVLQDTMINLIYETVNETIEYTNRNLFPLTQSHLVILSLYVAMLSSKRSTSRKHYKVNSVYSATYLFLSLVNNCMRPGMPSPSLTEL